MTQKTVGILGGWGPEATLDLCRRILERTPAKVDQDHLHLVIDCNPKMPDPNSAIMCGGADPTAELQATARNLERAGADLVVMPCNTGHIFTEALRACMSVPLVSIVDETVRAIRALASGARRIGLMASPAVIATGLYARPLQAKGIETVTPDEAGQRALLDVILAVKAGDKGPQVRARAREAAEDLIRRGAEALVLGCTELPLVLGHEEFGIPVLDTLDILAAAAVREAFSTP